MLRKLAQLTARALRRGMVLIISVYILVLFAAAVMTASIDHLMLGLAMLPVLATVSALFKWAPEVLSGFIPISPSTVRVYSRGIFVISVTLLSLFNIGAIAAFSTGKITGYQLLLIIFMQLIIYLSMFVAAFWTTVNIKHTTEWPPEDDWKRHALNALNQVREII